MSEDSILYLRYGVFAVFAGMMLAAVVWDLRKFIIPNWLNAAIFLLFPVAALALPDEFPWLSHYGAALLGGVCVAPLFFLGWLGAGDVKMFAAVALWAGFAELTALAFYVSGLGGLLALLLIVLRYLARVALRPRTQPDTLVLPRVLQPDAPLPYGVAIAAGAVLTAFRLPYLGFAV